MKAQRNVLRWMGMAVLFAAFVSFTFLLPPALAQGENPETTPIPEGTPEPLAIPEIESESGVQRFASLAGAELGGDWAAQVNVSDTEGESSKPQIATDENGNLHIVWRETIDGNQEIFYTWIDVNQTIQSLPVNVSNSPSFDSQAPQLVVDSTGIAHIVWQETDNDHGMIMKYNIAIVK